MKKFFIQLIAAAAVCNLFAAEVCPSKPANFIFGDRLTEKDGVLSAAKSSEFYSKLRLNIDTTKRYRLSGEFRHTEGKGVGMIKFGIVPATKQRQIIPASIKIRPNTETELVADCKAADTVLKVKDASKWSATVIDRVVFDIDPSGKMRDIPNFNISKGAVKSVVKKDDHYEITLTAPCGVNFAAGSFIREHQAGWIAMFCCGYNKKLTTQWKTFAHTFEPGSVTTDNIYRWWRGTEIATIYIQLTVPAGQRVEFRNIKLEELPPQK